MYVLNLIPFMGNPVDYSVLYSLPHSTHTQSKRDHLDFLFNLRLIHNAHTEVYIIIIFILFTLILGRKKNVFNNLKYFFLS